MFCTDAFCSVSILFQPFKPNIGHLGQFVWPNFYFFLFSHFLVPSGHIWDIISVEIRRNWSVRMTSVLFQPFLNIVFFLNGLNSKNANFGSFLGLFGYWRAQICCVFPFQRRSGHMVGREKRMMTALEHFSKCIPQI